MFFDSLIKRGFDGTVETWNSVGIVKPTLICRVSCQRDTKDMVIERLMGCFDDNGIMYSWPVISMSGQVIESKFFDRELEMMLQLVL